ncbi:MAG: glycosyltransferase family 4 protein [Archaeoglobus sp.]|nr:glycosyltransferase family 4 protein [Archaeoglobus sp.]
MKGEIELEHKPKIAVVTFPWAAYAPYKFLSDMIKILEPISSKIVVITGNSDRIIVSSEIVRDINVSIHYLRDIRPIFYSLILWITKCILAQIKISLELIRSREEIDVVVFYIAYPYYLFPLIISKILRKKAIEVITRSKPNSFISKIISLQDPILYKLLDGISPETKTLANDLRLDRYNNKILPEGARFIDTDKYNIKKQINTRKNIIGFIGRIRKEKGIIEFVKAIPIIARANRNLEFLIGGSGDLLDWVKRECKKLDEEYGVKITVTGFIKEEEFSHYLNEIKLLVLPTTHTEGLPTMILEAMACGTPVLATSKGAISDVIKDGKTGFIMENNSPENIAKSIIKVLNSSELDRVSYNARKVVLRRFTYFESVKRYEKIINMVIGRG